MKRYILILIGIMLMMGAFVPPLSQALPVLAQESEFPIMTPSRETVQEWMQRYNAAPEAPTKDQVFGVGVDPGYAPDVNLLGHLDYIPAQRNQGSCPNCWAWAGTGVMEVAHDFQNAVYDRLSVQYINSCQSAEIGKTCCTGGWLANLADFYTSTGMAIPWSNTNAQWQDGDASCDTSCGSISTTPNYPINSITDLTISTYGVGEAAAIDNIKNVLNQNKAVWFGFFLPTGDDWSDFFTFWLSNPETTIWNPDSACGEMYVYPPAPNPGGGHAVLCVGYHDEAGTANDYWLMLNSWGTASGGRPNGLFRVDMHMNYSCFYVGLGQAFLWQTLDIEFAGVPAVPVTIDAPDTVLPGEDFTATVDIGDVVNLNAVQYDVSFDPSVFRLDDVTPGQIDSTTIPIDGFSEIAPGTYRVVQSLGLSSVSGNGYLATLHFHVMVNADEISNIDLSNGILSDMSAEEITATWIGDSVQLVSISEKLIGADDAVCSGSASPGYLCMSRFQATKSCDMTQFRLKASTSGSVKVALYADSAGAPGALLNAVNTATPVVAGWNTITFPSTSLTSGNYYWLAFNSSSAVACYNSAPGTFRFRLFPFSSSFPNPAGTGFNPSSITGLLAGWGSCPPPVAPTVTNSTGESDLTSNSARLNGQITDTGGEDPTVIIYWGDNDGDTTTGSWDNNVDLGINGAGTFYTDISSLSPSTDYYYRCFASNSGGSAWAASTEQLTTMSPPDPPTVTNSTGESDLTSNSARLNGEVTATGGENPTVIIYWGDNDGGTMPGSWDNNVDLGINGAGTFYTDISSLSPSTDYYYRCFASNYGGPNWADSTEQFTTLPAPEKLIGADDAACSGSAAAGYLCMSRFQATKSCDMTQFRLKASASGDVKVALYADSAGAPGTLLNAVNTATPVIAGWNTITFPSTSLTSGNYYWLAFNSSSAVACYNSAPGTFRFRLFPFSSSFPNPAGTGFNPSSITGLLAGWGSCPPPVPPEPPILVSPGTSITFKWNAATGATKYWLEVNTQPDFSGDEVFNSELGNVTEHEITTGLLLGTTYYWRVQAGNDSGWSDWSLVRSVLADTVVP